MLVDDKNKLAFPVNKNDNIKQIAKTTQGSILITYSALQEILISIVNSLLTTKDVIFEKLEFDQFKHDTNFQVNVFLNVKNQSKFSYKSVNNLQKAIQEYLKNEFQIEVLSVNIISNISSK